jgi:cyclic-di-GMP phosphodiesterase TipF (flagellum assembly factor)
MLDVIVLIAMAITALAFAVGLIVQSGVAQIPAFIAGVALYMVMAASYLMVARTGRPGAAGGDRLAELEEALEIIDKDLQRIDRVEDDVSRLDVLAERVERIDQALNDYAATAPIGGLSRPEQFAQEFEEVPSKIEIMRADLEGEARSQREKITSDLRGLEGLIKQLSQDLIEASSAEAATPAQVRASWSAPRPLAEIKKIEAEEDEPETEAEEPEPVAIVEEIVEVVESLPEPIEAPPALEPARETFASVEETPAKPSVFVAEPAVEPEVAAPVGEIEMLDIVSQAIEAGRVDLYLQQTVSLPARKPRYFEALTRIRTRTDALVMPGAYLPVAESSGMMPLIDNVLLVKSVQTLRRLGSGSRIKGVFCNLSVKTLLDPEFFPELVEFMEENSGLSESLVFELSQPGFRSLSPDELGALDTLGALGYGFSLDHVADLDLDFSALSDRAFRFVKIDAKTFLNNLEAKGSQFSAPEMKRALGDFGLTLIVEKVEDESEVARLLEYGVELAQGHLFGKPRPMSPALFREIENADAA